jgi:hypothetical protein
VPDLWIWGYPLGRASSVPLVLHANRRGTLEDPPTPMETWGRVSSFPVPTPMETHSSLELDVKRYFWKMFFLVPLSCKVYRYVSSCGLCYVSAHANPYNIVEDWGLKSYKNVICVPNGSNLQWGAKSLTLPEEATAKVQLSWSSGGGIGMLYVYVTSLAIITCMVCQYF